MNKFFKFMMKHKVCVFITVILELSRNVQSKNALNMINIDKCT